MSNTNLLAEKEKDAVEFASRAVKFDGEEKHEASIYYYKEAADSILEALKLGSSVPGLKDKAHEYIGRAEVLADLFQSRDKIQSKSQQHQDLGKAEFLLHQALDEDEDGTVEEAISLYSEAVDLCLKARKATSDPYLLEKLGNLAKQALGRAETLKNSISHSLKTSFINTREYVPFMKVDLKEKFAYPISFSDKDGKLELSPKQKSLFHRWIRPEDISPDPKMIELVDCFSIKQTVVSDCSFVASVAVSALYEKKFNKKLITSIIYPQNKQGNPVYNPCGKYMIKLHINGVPRKVIVDDYFPAGRRGELLCSYSSNKNELWISLLEKAYMKVMGGYDFPGSNSNIDLHALTGWIPERVSIQSSEFNRDAVFRKIIERHNKGDVLVTLATGELPELEAERAGLVPTHAYAMLDIKEVNGKRLLLLKNPWSHLRWKGNFSERDTVNWTRAMKEAVRYDPKSAQQFDNGVFWIDYESVIQFYDVFYMSWNPSLFKYTYCTHQFWNAGKGPAKDVYNIGENPQYSLNVNSDNSAVWILLSRHITDKEDFANNREYIAIMVYKSDGKRIFLPYDPPPHIDGVRINSPHYLCKILIPDRGSTSYTLVVSQYEKSTTIYYSLRAYSTCPFTLKKLEDPYLHRQEITNGQWTSATAGGCANYRETCKNNPIYQIVLQSSSDNSEIMIDIKGPKQYQVGFEVVCVSVNNTKAPGYFSRKVVSVFRSGFNMLTLEKVPSGVYNIIPSTFAPGQKGPFFLTIRSSCQFKVSHLQ
ncbi:Calpain-7 [Nymphon striatum]|nr:Calpain-7 [Nymphon striatum]